VTPSVQTLDGFKMLAFGLKIDPPPLPLPTLPTLHPPPTPPPPKTHTQAQVPRAPWAQPPPAAMLPWAPAWCRPPAASPLSTRCGAHMSAQSTTTWRCLRRGARQRSKSKTYGWVCGGGAGWCLGHPDPRLPHVQCCLHAPHVTKTSAGRFACLQQSHICTMLGSKV
jgi:hypothetical protein